MEEDIPIGLQLNRVQNFLLKQLESYTSEELLRHTGIDIENNPEILDSLTGDASKVLRDKEGKWRWASRYQLSNSVELHSLITRSLDGVSEKDLYDSYKTVKDDIKLLKKRNAVFEIKSGSKIMLFPRDPRLNVTISPELVQRYTNVTLPDEIEVHRYLVSNGLKQTDDATGISIAQPISRKRPSRRADRKKRTKMMKLTNTHMVGTSIDLTKDYDNAKESAFK